MLRCEHCKREVLHFYGQLVHRDNYTVECYIPSTARLPVYVATVEKR